MTYCYIYPLNDVLNGWYEYLTAAQIMWWRLAGYGVNTEVRK